MSLRRPDSISDSETKISDPILEPYFITKNSAGGFVVYENVVKGANNTKYIRTVCYPSTFGRAIKVVAEEKLNSDSYNSLEKYINSWDKITTDFQEIVG